MRSSEIGSRDRSLRQLETVSQRLSRIQDQLASGRRIERASDDPVGTSVALGYRVSLAYETQMRRNIENATGQLDITDAALFSATEAIQRLRELAISAGNPTLGAHERSSIASEVDQLTQQLVQVANTNFGGEYIFAGHQSRDPAYTVTGEPPASVIYNGDLGVRARQVSTTDAIDVNIPGSTIFGAVFDDLITFRQALETNAPPAQLQQGIAFMDAALDRVLSARATVGSRTARLEATKYQSESTDLTLQTLQSNVEHVDIAEAIVQLNAQQNALQATLGAIGRASSMTLLDFLR